MFTKTLLFISIFIMTVRFNHSLSNKCTQLHYFITKKFEKICQIQILNNESLFENNNNICITVSGNKKTLGNILTCNSSVQKHLGYDPKKLLTKNILILLPKFLQKMHHQYLMNFLETGKSYILNTIRINPVLHENQTIDFMNLHIQANPTLNHGLLFIGILRPIHSKNESILLTYDGQIDGMSEKITKLFQFNEINMQTSFLRMIEGYAHIHYVFNFIRFTDIILIKPCTNITKLINLCEDYQNHTKDELEIQMAFRDIQKIMTCCNSLDELKEKIMNMKKYKKIKNIYDLYSVDEINFRLKINNDDCMTDYLIKCNLHDEIYQDNQFLRILDIIDIQLDPHNTMLKSYKVPSIEEINNISMEDLKILGDIYGYNYQYHKKTKIEIENNIIFLDTRNNVHNQTGAMIMENQISSVRYIDIKKDYPKINDQIQNNPKISILPRLNQYNKENIMENSHTQLSINTNNSHLSNINIIRVNQKTSSSTLSKYFTKNYIEKKINEALDYIYISDLNKFIIVMIIGFFAISTILGIITYNAQITIESSYLQNTSALYSWNMAYKRLMDISYITKEVYCVQNDYIPNDLWDFLGVPDLLDYDIAYVGEGAIVFKKYFEDFATEIYSLTEDLKNEILLTPIRMIDVDPITFGLNPNYITQNIISAVYELINKLIYVGSIPFEEKWNTTNEIIYVINNVYGDICIAQQKINTIIFQAIVNSYTNLQNEKMINYIIIISVGILCLVILKFQMMQYYKKQCQFLKNLVKLQSQKTVLIQKNIENALEFLKCDAIEENLLEFKSKVEKQNNIKQIETENNQIYKSNNLSDTINSTLIKRRNYLKALLGLCFISIFILIFLLDYTLSKNKQIQNEMNALRFIETLSRYSNNSLADGLFYVYLASNGTGTFRNNDISLELDALYHSKSDTSHFRSIFMDKNQNYQYSEYLIENACKLIDPYMEQFCITWGSQRAEYGIFALEEWIGNTLILLKESFDSSNRSREVINEYFTIKEFIDIIGIDFSVQIYPYNALSAAIKNDIDNKIIKDRQENIQFMVLTLISFILSILIFGYPLSRKICMEYIELKILLKMFPTRIFLKQTYLKNFIFQTSKPILQNIRNQL